MADKPVQITLDQLISSTSTSVLRALQEHQAQTRGPIINPRIWVGYWIDLNHGVQTVPGGVAGPGGLANQ